MIPIAAKIYVSPPEIPAFYEENRKRLKNEMILIAENTETGHEVYLTESYNAPIFVVTHDDEIERFYVVSVYYDFIKTSEDVYSTYIESDESENSIAEEIEEDREDLIMERDGELRLALTDFLAAVTSCDETEADMITEFGEDTINDILDDFLDILSQNYDFEIWRPSYLPNEYGEPYYTEFPYKD